MAECYLILSQKFQFYNESVTGITYLRYEERQNWGSHNLAWIHTSQLQVLTYKIN